MERTDQVETGIWECTPDAGGGRSSSRSSATSCKAAAPSLPDGGETIRIEAGDALLLPENSLGVWDVQETVRKSYVIIHR